MVQADPTLKKIDLMTARSGRMLKEDDTPINAADMIEAIYKALVVDKNAGVVLGEGNELSVELEEGTLVGLIDGSKVDLVTGAEVNLADGTEVDLVDGAKVNIVGNTLVEQKTHVDAVANVLTFSQNIGVIEIYHKETTWQTFIVNGLSIVVPTGGYRTPIGGVASPNVTIPAAVNCIVGRLI